MRNIGDTFVLIVIALFSLLLVPSLAPAQDEPLIERPDIPSENNTPPVQNGNPAEDTEEFLKLVVLEPGASCITESCHASMEQKKYIHAVGVDGMKCSRCHELLTEDRHAFKKIPPETMFLCAQCHSADALPPEDLIKSPPKVLSENEAKLLHKPFAEGKCTACHDAHSSNHYKHLKLSLPEGLYAPYQDNTYSLCASCHKDLDKKLTEPRTLDLTMFRNGNVNLHYRHVNKKKGRTCKTCHHSHGLDKSGLMRDTFQFGNRMLTVNYEKTETGGKCSTTCHRESLYDRYKAQFNFIKTEPLPVEDATEDELEQSRKDDLKRLREKATDRGTIEGNNDKDQM